MEVFAALLALFGLVAMFCWFLVRTNGPRTFHQHHYMHEDPATVRMYDSRVALNHADTVSKWQMVEARQQALDARGVHPPAELDPLGTEYDAWLARRPRELGRSS